MERTILSEVKEMADNTREGNNIMDVMNQNYSLRNCSGAVDEAEVKCTMCYFYMQQRQTRGPRFTLMFEEHHSPQQSPNERPPPATK